VPIALVAVGGAAACLLTRRVKPEKVYREIDWHLLVLFTGLFVVIGGVEAARLTDSLFALKEQGACPFVPPCVRGKTVIRAGSGGAAGYGQNSREARRAPSARLPSFAHTTPGSTAA
jgi:hypothetical protein